MAIVSTERPVKAAHDNGYAVGRLDTNNLEWAQTILRAAEAKKTPVLAQTPMGAAKYMDGYELCKVLIENPAESMGITVPIATHLDHGYFEDALECIEVGYTSTMFSSSRLSLEENLEKAKGVVARVHVKGTLVETEAGIIGGEEDGIISDGELAPIEDAKVMVATEIDFLTAGIGNIYGPYPASRKSLHFDHLEKLAAAVPGFPVVLHDGPGIPDDQIQAAIKLGIAKVNVNTECQLALAKVTRRFITGYEVDEEEYDKEKFFDSYKFLKPGFETIIGAAKGRTDVFGSASKA